MQASTSRRIFTGLSSDVIPSSAPYGQRYRHQKFWISMKQNQQTDDDCRCLPDIAEEIQHLDIGDQAVRCGHEIVDRLGGHGADQEHGAQKQVLQPS